MLHWILKDYKDNTGKPLDMVQPQASARFGLPLSLFTYEPALTTQLNQALYQVTVSGAASATGCAGAEFAELPLRGQRSGGLEDLSLRHRVRGQRRGPGKALRRTGADFGGVAGGARRHGGVPRSADKGNPLRTSASSQFVWSLDGKQDQQAAAKISGNATLDSPTPMRRSPISTLPRRLCRRI